MSPPFRPTGASHPARMGSHDREALTPDGAGRGFVRAACPSGAFRRPSRTVLVLCHRAIAVAAALVAAAFSPAADASIVHFSNGRQIWTSINSGAAFTQSGSVTSVSDVSNLSNFGVVALGYYEPTGTFYASGSNGHLYTATGLGSAVVTLDFYRDLGSATISFDFFGSQFRGLRGKQIVAFDMGLNDAMIVLNPNTGVGGFPSTAAVNGGYFGVNSSGSLYEINASGLATNLGTTGIGHLSVAGGDGYGNAFHIVSAVNASGSNDVMRFGTINVATKQYTEISQTAIGNVAGATGLVVIPGPGALAFVALAGLVRGRRTRRRAGWRTTTS